ncbi:DUF6262 family protein [Streptomyces sp. GMR22]|uniref:DUF6262 family protein n=1 Tax=Streptomyces sp. GMR22 TaxID=2759524 RepID=UPI0015F973F8|nr:DUF6262 family protein [Streptomyces sp. GMR22]MBA6433836.1 hypothetical protein [Streptomyces sp. GMR22]
MTASRTPGDVLRETRQRDSREKRAAVRAVIDDMLRRDEPITFAAVAKAAGVSRWLVYADGVRDHIDTARRQQATRRRREKTNGSTASAASLQTDLAFTREENTRLRAEVGKLRDALRRQLGQQLGQASSADLAERIKELTTENQRLITRLEEHAAENARLLGELAEAEDDLAATRLSLRQMIRAQNAESDS